MKKWLFWLAGWAIAPVLAAPIDAVDAGDYVLLDMQGKPTPMQMRYYQRGNQWLMDGRTLPEDWHSVCRGDGECRLIASNHRDIEKWQKMLPEKYRQSPLHCINNIAFAFCRNQIGKERHYWWVSLVSGRTILLPVQPLGK